MVTRGFVEVVWRVSYGCLVGAWREYRVRLIKKRIWIKTGQIKTGWVRSEQVGMGID